MKNHGNKRKTIILFFIENHFIFEISFDYDKCFRYAENSDLEHFRECLILIYSKLKKRNTVMKVADRYLTSWSIVEEYKVVFIASESENSRKS